MKLKATLRLKPSTDNASSAQKKEKLTNKKTHNRRIVSTVIQIRVCFFLFHTLE